MSEELDRDYEPLQQEVDRFRKKPERRYQSENHSNKYQKEYRYEHPRIPCEMLQE